MEPLKKGANGASVKELQETLRELDYNITVDSSFGTETYNAVRAFQASHLDKHGIPLKVDGAVGDITWWALKNPRVTVSSGVIDYKTMPPTSMGGSALGRGALQAAINELIAGAGEIGGNNRGPFVRKYFAPSGVAEGNSWCAAFVSWCFFESAGGNKNAMGFNYTAGARNVFDQLKKKGETFSGTTDGLTPEPGDLVAWWRVSLPSYHGHIGIVHHVQDGFLYTIEGNKAANVAGFSYVKTRMDKLLGYARVK
ncbi:hypothetical protein ACVWYG_000070 [Pedobacter sp. UYEF25]